MRTKLKNLWLPAVLMVAMLLPLVFQGGGIAAFAAKKTPPEGTVGQEIEWNDYVVTNGTAANDRDEEAYTAVATIYNWSTMEESLKQDKYLAKRDFTAIPAIAVTGDRWWCAFMIGGDSEPHPENCLSVAYSDDGGLTWEDPVLIVDFAADVDPNVRTTDPILMFDGGRLFLFWTQNHETQTNYQCVWRTEILNYNGAKEEVSATTPEFCCYGNFWKITILKNGTWAAGIQCHGIKWALGFYVVSRDYGKTWYFRGYADNPDEDSAHNEVSIVERSNGTLWMTKRIQWQSKQGVEESYSTDGGYTWTDFAFTEYPLKGPGSKFTFIYTRTGSLVFINHDTIEDRKLMTAFISKDEGVTWESSKLLLDERQGVSYPAVALDKDGNVLVVYDMGRETNREIRIAKISEADILAGRIVTPGNYIKGLVSIGSDNLDLVSAQEDYAEISCFAGTDASLLRERLPSTLHVTDHKGTQYTVSGIWDLSKVDLKTVGEYEAVFRPSAGLSEKVVDVRNILTTRIVVKAQEPVAILSVSGKADIFVAAGTPIHEVREALPQKLTLTDAQGNSYEAYGYWTSETYASAEGEYLFTFRAVSELPSYLTDSNNLLTARVTVRSAAQGEDDAGCGAALSAWGGGAAALIAAGAAVLVLARRRGGEA